MDSLSFNSEMFFLGKLCIRSHEYQNTQQTLRYQGNKDCPECHKISRRKYLSTEKGKQVHRECTKNFYLGEKGKAKKREYFYKYSAKPESKLSKANADKKYRQSAKGKLSTQSTRHKRRAQQISVHCVDVTTEQIKQRFLEFKDKCAYCDAKTVLTLEHFLPLSKGGTHVLGNLLPACKSCNCSKTNLDPESWYQSRTFYSKKRWSKILSVLGKSRSSPNQIPLL